MQDIFRGLKVLELASVLAGPSVGQFFAELGAHVLKIENKIQNGDITRSWKLATEDPNHPFSAYYSSVNYGKESLFLDLTNPSDFEQVVNRIKDADIVIANFKPGDAIKLKLDYESIKVINHNIIYGEITGFDNSNRLAYDIVLQAESGFLAMTGTKEGELCKLPVALIDLLAAHQLKEGILLAMLKQKEESTALKVTVSLFDSALSALANQATNWLMAKHIPEPMGTLHPNIAPYGELFSCKNGKQLVLAIGSKRQYKSLCSLLELDLLASDQRFIDNQSRLKNRSELADLIARKIKLHSREDLMKRFADAEIPAGAVRKMDEVFELSGAKKQLLKEVKEGHQLISVKGNSFVITN